VLNTLHLAFRRHVLALSVLLFLGWTGAVSASSGREERLTSQARPAVVQIEVSRIFGTGAGTGFFVSSSGLVLTNHHVVENARSILLKREDGSFLQAQHIASNTDLDIALLRPEATVENYPCLALGDDRDVQQGRRVLAIGNPMGTGGAVSGGLVSQLVRGARDPLTNEVGNILIQVDAAINPGNSGGPLIDLSTGKVIGVMTLKRADAEGVSYAVPISLIRRQFSDRLESVLCRGTVALPSVPGARPVSHAGGGGAVGGSAAGGGGGGGALAWPVPAQYGQTAASGARGALPYVLLGLLVVIFGTLLAVVYWKRRTPGGPPVQARLVIQPDEMAACWRFPLGRRRFIVGDGARAHARVQIPGVHPVHLTFTWNGRFHVVQPSATTSLNGTPLYAAHPLKSGDVLRIPSTTVRYERS
jgi:S1-C subfamily serine protease